MVRSHSVAKNDRSPYPSRYERRLFPPEQSSKTSSPLNEFPPNRKKIYSFHLDRDLGNISLRSDALLGSTNCRN